MKKYVFITAVSFFFMTLSAGPAFLGYLYPSGGQRGTTVRVVAGGQGFGGNVTLLSDNPGVKLKSVARVPNMGYFHPPQRKFLHQFIKNVYAGKMEKPPMPEDTGDYVWRKHQWLDELDKLPMLERSMVAQALLVRASSLQEAPSISQRVIMDIEIAPDAPAGACRLRIVSGRNISNEKLFFIDTAGEVIEHPYYPPFAKKPELAVITEFPAVLNGQIMPGETDVFPVQLQGGQNYTFIMRAAELSPYLGDAVPGHFQGVLSLRDARNQEMAFADDEYHHPDPVLRFTAPASGIYTLHVSDSIKRGRADFVYRIKVIEGNKPFEPYRNCSGYRPRTLEYAAGDVPQMISPALRKNGLDIKGYLDSPAGISFRISGCKGERTIFELFAARLDSPLDGVLVLRDEQGKIIAQNDDFPQNINLDLCRRPVDPLLDVTFPADGNYFLQLFPRGSSTGKDHSYTLQIRPPEPSVTVAAANSVLALNGKGVGKMRFMLRREDGFNGEVEIVSPQLTAVDRALIPAGEDSGEFSFYLTDPPKKSRIIQLEIFAEYTVNGKKISVPVIPADEAMQAFAYTHLVAAGKFYCFTIRHVPTAKVSAK
ncbi:MAG: hypothetical protein J6S43_05455 [Lentisphaeria bacterium]|nr:hypothetical protein [Lentisphaeria bacterium]